MADLVHRTDCQPVNVTSNKGVFYSVMAPPTKILGLDTQQRMLQRGENCSLKSLVQNECAFNGNDYVCTPFKRLFEQCMVKDGRVLNIEVTNLNTNR